MSFIILISYDYAYVLWMRLRKEIDFNLPFLLRNKYISCWS